MGTVWFGFATKENEDTVCGVIVTRNELLAGTRMMGMKLLIKKVNVIGLNRAVHPKTYGFVSERGISSIMMSFAVLLI